MTSFVIFLLMFIFAVRLQYGKTIKFLGIEMQLIEPGVMTRKSFQARLFSKASHQHKDICKA